MGQEPPFGPRIGVARTLAALPVVSLFAGCNFHCAPSSLNMGTELGTMERDRFLRVTSISSGGRVFRQPRAGKHRARGCAHREQIRSAAEQVRGMASLHPNIETEKLKPQPALTPKARRRHLIATCQSCGGYPAPKLRATSARKRFSKWPTVKFAQRVLEINTQSMDELRKVLFGGIPTVRINTKYTQPEMATDMLEADMYKLSKLWSRGRDSAREQEAKLKEYLL
jgi:hypothetical protein